MGLCVICQNRKTHFHAHFSPKVSFHTWFSWFIMKPFFLAFIWSRIGSEKRHTKENVQLNSCRLRWLVLGWLDDGWLVGWDGTENIFLPSSCFVIWEICFLPLNTRCISLLVSGDICWSHFQLKPPLGSQLKSLVPTNCWTIKQVDQHHKRLNFFSHTLF